MNQMYPTHYRSLFYAHALVVAITLPCILCSSPVDPRYANNCTQPFNCGDTRVLGELKYPFWGINRPSYCGKRGFELMCLNNTPVINISATVLQIIGANPQAHKITVAFKDLSNSLCPSAALTETNNTGAYAYASVVGDRNFDSLFTKSSFRFLMLLYGCPSKVGHDLGWSGVGSCSINNSTVDVHFVTDAVNVSTRASGCKSVVSLPIPKDKAQALDESNITTLYKAVDEGFEMTWLPQGDDTCKACVGSGGQCDYNETTLHFICYCLNTTYSLQCPQSQRGLSKRMVLIIASSAGIGIVVLCLLILFSLQVLRKRQLFPEYQRVEDLLNSYESIGPRRYTYANIMKMTNSFRKKIGEGGYGTVFKGKLPDGRIVAIKVLKQSKGDGQEFINEVVSISRTSHVNIVSFLGFCFEGHKCALIYEFMSNGSLEKFTSGRDPNGHTLSFTTPKLLEIALGIAKGLEYLHKGCNTRIVHFDIKPHNIMLDDEFTPKISDFGLAKPFKKNESIISMSEARGTVGYIAPEVFFRSVGGVSHKSDVYSYGMMVLEMVGCSEKPDGYSERSSEVYFPQWIYEELEQEPTLDSGRILNNADELKRKMILVGLWCIQTNPSDRPPMSKVVEMLEGEVESLQVPPMPSLYSLPRQQ